MARRFRRENFLFPLDIRKPRGEVAARPTDPFTRASEGTVEQAPQRPFEVNRPSGDNRLIQLSESLGIATRAAREISDTQYEDFTRRAEAAGVNLATQDELAGNRRSFRQVISQTRQANGDEAAREVMGLSPHIKKGFDQTRARSAALGYNAALQSAYGSNPLLDEESGTRLHDVDADSPEYQQWLQGFTENFQQAEGVNLLDPVAQSTFTPALQDAQTRVTLAHDELRSTYKLREFEQETSEFVNNALYELNGNPGWVSGEESDALSLAANLITNQLDEANSLGYGGQDLQAIYAQVVENVIATAQTTGNASLLDVLDIIEVGNPNSRSLLLDQPNAGKYKSAILSARQNIVDREFQQGQRNRQLRDQRREDSMNDGLEALALMAGLYENAGRTPEAFQSLQAVIEDVRGDAAVDGWTVELNSVVTRITQEAVDNQGVNIIDYPAMANLENSILNEQIGGETAQRRLRDMYISGALGNNQQAAENFLRLSSKIKANDDQALSAFGSEVDQAASAYEQVIRGRMGYTEDEYGRVQSVRDTLTGAGFNESQMATLMNMSQSELEQRIADNAEAAAQNQALPYSAATIQAMNMVVNGDINPLNPPEPVDPGDITRQSIEFKNQLYRGFAEFREREGRDMTPQERGDYIRRQSEAAITGQRADLPRSNPLSSTGAANNPVRSYQDRLFDNVLENVGESGGDPRNSAVLDSTQVIKAFEHFIISDSWHPEIVALADANNMSPMTLIQRQSALNGAEIDPDLMVTIGLPTGARPGDYLPGSSVFSSNRDISRDYAPGQYTTFTGNFIDDWSSSGVYMPGSYDFTFIQNDRTDINVPAPFDGVVTEVWTEANSGGYGNGLVIKDRATGVEMFIAHAAATYLDVGDRFVRGQAILKQGNTGNSDGDHLHVEILDENGVRNPDRSFTRPIIDQWISDVESGFFQVSPSANVASQGSSSGPLQPNSSPPRYGYPGFDEARNLAVAEVASDGYEYQLQPQAASAYNQMKQEAARQGINLEIVSAFRSVDLQDQLWRNKINEVGSESEAARRVAPPGHSRHHTGLTVDLNSLQDSFANTEEYRWLQQNAGRFGFELSYPEGNTAGADFEPWEWTFTGGSSSGGSGGPNPQATREPEFFNSIASSANRLGVDPLELAAVLAKESSLNIYADNGSHQGLFQASSDVRRRYGVYAGQPAGQQLAALERYLADRGYEPGMGIEGLYATILVGNPWNRSSGGVYNPADGNGTTVLDAIERFREGGDKREEARQYFGL